MKSYFWVIRSSNDERLARFENLNDLIRFCNSCFYQITRKSQGSTPNNLYFFVAQLKHGFEVLKPDNKKFM
jgi:hypothetical protein